MLPFKSWKPPAEPGLGRWLSALASLGEGKKEKDSKKQTTDKKTETLGRLVVRVPAERERETDGRQREQSTNYKREKTQS